jgi:D-threo-aldose 1-dehydrogenase
MDYGLIFIPFGHFDAPETLRYAITQICRKCTDVIHTSPMALTAHPVMGGLPKGLDLVQVESGRTPQSRRSRRTISRTGLDIDVRGFGGSRIGNLHGPVPSSDATAALDAAWDLGIRYFDTAPYYGGGLGEHRMGAALRHRPRAEFVLSTKVGRLQVPQLGSDETIAAADALPFRVVHHYSAAGVEKSLADSQQRLGMARIDIALIHDIDASNHGIDQKRRFAEAMAGAYPALVAAKAAGQVGAIGVGVNDWRVLAACAEQGDFDVFLLAGRYTLLEHEEALPFLDMCAAQNISVIIGSPFNSGILAKGPAGAYNDSPPPGAIATRTARLAKLAADHGIPLGAAALQFPLAHPAVISVLPGLRSAVQVTDCVEWMALSVPTSFWSALRQLGLVGDKVPLLENEEL